MSMVERLVYTVIKGGLDYYKADEGQRFERFLIDELRLSTAEAARGRIYFAGGTLEDATVVDARPPTLHHGYPRTGGPFPAWAITLGGEREAQVYLGDDAVPLDEDGERFMDPDTGLVVDPKIRRVEYTYNVLCIADHPDVTLYYYSLLKRIILAERAAFIAADLDVPTLNGADLAPDPRYLPNDVFARQLSITLQGDECWTEAIEGGFAATTIRGIAVDDTGDQKTSGDVADSVNARITTYAAGS